MDTEPDSDEETLDQQQIKRVEEILPWSKACTVASRESAEQHPINYHINEKISLWQGTIVKLNTDCIVNAAKSDLSGGEGVDKAIWAAAGKKELAQACQEVRPCPVGECRVTPGFKLPCKFILHAVGPCGEDPIKLQSCYTNCLDTMLNLNMKSIAFCCISTGAYGYPPVSAAHIALSTTRQWLESNHSSISRVVFCVFEDSDLKIYQDLMVNKYFRNDIDFFFSSNTVKSTPKLFKQIPYSRQ